MLAQLVGKVSFIAWFNTHQEEITETCCVNKNKPELNCKANCFLVETLADIDDQSETKSTSGKGKHTHEELLFFEKFELTQGPFNQPSNWYSTYVCLYSFLFKPNVFEPPQVLSLLIG